MAAELEKALPGRKDWTATHRLLTKIHAELTAVCRENGADPKLVLKLVAIELMHESLELPAELWT